jgi:hypothetical protein
MLLSGASASLFDLVGVLSLILLGWCGLPRLFGLITASVLLIYKLVRSVVSSLALSSLVAVNSGVGYTSICSPA